MAYRSSAAGEEDYDAFRVLSAAEGGQLPEEVRDGLENLANTLTPVLGDQTDGYVGIRFGRRVIVAPVDKPEDAVDVADVDLARRVLLTVGGRDPGPTGALLAKILFLRTDAAVGFARGGAQAGPTMGVLEEVLVPLQTSPATAVPGVATVAVGMQPRDLAGALESVDLNEAGGSAE